MLCIDRGPRDDDRRPIAVVGAVHGDEPCGVRAIHSVLARDPDFQRPVRFIIANERALRRDQRCVDVDLNRVFPGDPTSDDHERRLAARLRPLLEGCEVLTLHSAEARPMPFALVQQWTPTTRALVRATGVDDVVDISYVDGGLEQSIDGIAVECGPMGSDAAAETAEVVIDRVLTARDALSGSVPVANPTVYEVFDTVDGGDLAFRGRNFEAVEAGEVFAHVRADARDDATNDSEGSGGHLVCADRPFYPVLMATDGYDDMLGFQAHCRGPLSTLH